MKTYSRQNKLDEGLSSKYMKSKAFWAVLVLSNLSWECELSLLLFSSCFSFDLFSMLQLGVFLDRRILSYILPVFLFVLLYSKLPHKVLDMEYELHSLMLFQLYFWTPLYYIYISFFFLPQELRFIISSVPIFNLSAAIAANRMYVPFLHCHTLFQLLCRNFFKTLICLYFITTNI